jgi:hypothetical protein
LILACLSRDPAGRPDATQLARALATLDVTPWTEAEASQWWGIHQPRTIATTSAIDVPA